METLLADFEADLARRGFERIDTHLSRVFLGERDVYKFKRAVNLGFADFRRRDARRLSCEAEIELNRRLAPDVYLGMLCLTRDQQGTLVLQDKAPVDAASEHEWLVHMRRLPDEARADNLLAQDRLSAADVARIAERLVAFHRDARCDQHTTAFGSATTVRGNVEENFTQVERSIERFLSAEEHAQVVNFQRTFLDTHEALFQWRCAGGRVRDGHGDLRLEHVYRRASGAFMAIDCIEFNERFRFADVCADLAFLVMDLDYHGRRDLAENLVLHYAQESADYGLYRMLDFYVSYRAFVRAKVASFLADDPEVSEGARKKARTEARRYFLLALAAAEPALESPLMLATMGTMACGKTTLAHALRERLSWPVLSADRVRKELLGVPLTAPLHNAPFQSAYAPEVTARVYAELFTRAEHVLSSGRGVILDASFRSCETRDHARKLATRFNVPTRFLQCVCSHETAERRLKDRAEGASVSDGRLAIHAQFRDSFEPAAELDPDSLMRIDTELALEDNVERILLALGVDTRARAV